MTLTGAAGSSPSKAPGGRRATKFTPEAIEKIKDLVAQGVNRDEIANLLDVTVGSLQVTCSRLGISLRRRSLQNRSAPRTLDPRGRTIPAPGSIGFAHVRERKTEEVPQTAAHTAPLARFAITVRHQGREVATDVPLTSRDIEKLALKALAQDIGIAELLGQILVAAIKNDILKGILRDEVPPSAA
jgi:hypothetical protein